MTFNIWFNLVVHCTHSRCPLLWSNPKFLWNYEDHLKEERVLKQVVQMWTKCWFWPCCIQNYILFLNDSLNLNFWDACLGYGGILIYMRDKSGNGCCQCWQWSKNETTACVRSVASLLPGNSHCPKTESQHPSRRLVGPFCGSGMCDHVTCCLE